MKWSLKIAQVAGIGIFVHWTFFLLLAWVVYAYLSAGQKEVAAFEGVILVLAIFACVVLHELGHALTGRHFGVQLGILRCSRSGASPGWRAFPKCPCRSSGSPLPDRPSTWSSQPCYLSSWRSQATSSAGGTLPCSADRF